jgi:hypothetical protein
MIFAKNKFDDVITNKAPIIAPKNTIRVANNQYFHVASPVPKKRGTEILKIEQYEIPKSIWKYEMGYKNTSRNI